MGYSIFVGSAGQGQLTAVIWSNSKFYRINTASAYNDNQWHNVVMARDGSNLEMYIDGQLENIIPATSEDLSNSNPLSIGADLIHHSRFYFKGTIDDVRIYNRAFNNEEIQTIYHENGWAN